jgi:hypothetical protein
MTEAQTTSSSDKNNKDWLWLILIIGLAALLRAPLFNIGLTIDDACTAYCIEADSVQELVSRIKEVEMSPPVYFSILKLVTMALGINTFAMALPSFIFGLATIPLVYLLGKATHGRAVGLLSAYFAAVSYLAILYSHEARTYAVAGFFIAAALTVFLRAIDKRPAIFTLLLLALCCGMAVMTHYISVMYIGIMGLVALIYRRGMWGYSIAASLALSLSPLLFWWPVLAYHRSVGTPWADVTPPSEFLKVFASNLSATLPLPVVAGFVLLITALPLGLFVYLCLQPKALINSCRNLVFSPHFVTLAACLVSSCSLFGFITPYIFGWVRYMTPIACTSWVLLAWALVALRRKYSGKMAKVVFVTALAALALMSAFETAARASQDCSGLRQLARDISAQKFGNAAYITAPDFVGIILVYYIKHECHKPLPELLGFADPSSGAMPPRHHNRAQWWHNPDMLKLYDARLEDLRKRGFTTIVLIRDDYKPQSLKMPTRDVTDKFEAFLGQKLDKLEATKIYRGRASSYEVSRYAFKNKTINHD